MPFQHTFRCNTKNCFKFEPILCCSTQLLVVHVYSIVHKHAVNACRASTLTLLLFSLSITGIGQVSGTWLIAKVLHGWGLATLWHWSILVQGWAARHLAINSHSWLTHTRTHTHSHTHTHIQPNCSSLYVTVTNTHRAVYKAFQWCAVRQPSALPVVLIHVNTYCTACSVNTF